MAKIRINIVEVWNLVSKLVPTIRKFIQAIHKNSDGGRRITAEEADAILDTAIRDIGKVLDQHLTDYVEGEYQKTNGNA